MMQLTEDQAKQLAALDAIRDEDIDLSDVPEQGGRTDWTRALMLGRVTHSTPTRRSGRR